VKIAVIADVHSNLEAFMAVLDAIDEESADLILNAGDLVGYGANPNEVIQLNREMKIRTIMGNHDFSSLELEDIESFNQTAAEALYWTHNELKDENKAYLRSLPRTMKIENIFAVHGSPEDELWEYVEPDAARKKLVHFFNVIKDEKINILAMGHTHLPFIRKLGKKLVVNPGSVGQPRDRNPKASYCVLDSKTLKAEIRRIEYLIDKAADKIRKAKLPDLLASRLFLGK
jgi:putative phosphoesterase